MTRRLAVLGTVLPLLAFVGCQRDAGRRHRTPIVNGASRHVAGHASGGAGAGRSPTNSARRAIRRRPDIRYAGPPARALSRAAGRPTPARAAPTAAHAGSSDAPNRSVKSCLSAYPAAATHNRSLRPSRAKPSGGTFTAPFSHILASGASR